MIKPEQIPYEVKLRLRNILLDGETDEAVAIAAAINAWPNRKDEWRDNITFDGKPIRYSVIIIPIPQESGNE